MVNWLRLNVNYLCIHSSIYPFTHLSINRPIDPSIHPPIHPYIPRSIDTCIHPPIHPSPPHYGGSPARWTQPICTTTKETKIGKRSDVATPGCEGGEVAGCTPEMPLGATARRGRRCRQSGKAKKESENIGHLWNSQINQQIKPTKF